MKIKSVPEDFVVKEVCSLEFKDKSKYGYFLLKKKNYTTNKAVEVISKVLNVFLKNVNYSGLKDKVSVSEQYISVYGYNKGNLEWKNTDLELKFLGYGDERINLGVSKFNNFVITVRDLSKKIPVNVKFMENYFDEQRFGKENFNIEIGRMLIKRNFKDLCKKLNLEVKNNDFVGALRNFNKKILKLYLHAYQSYLFNLVLKEYIKLKFSKNNVKNGFLFTDLDNFNDLKIPLLNFDTKFNDEVIEKIYLELLNKEKIIQKDFLIREMPELISLGVERDAFINIKELNYKYLNDELNEGKLKCILNFTLPAGSYATILIKKIFG
ncbi:tRNA pseudouridine(13) synthase TruD [Candidatus Woesearchaeota archaeon]|nr:tRNA pseudouridine(13) synthase TruD [Candidatus Woesearchaeota archaeon]